jgi:hypothetical protein
MSAVSRVSRVALILALACGAAAAIPAAVTADPARLTTSALRFPAGFDPSEPHLAMDPTDSRRLFAVAQGAPSSQLPKEVLWRTADGGSTWRRSGLLGGVGNGARGISGDPVVAALGGDRVLFGTLTYDFDIPAGVAIGHVGTRVSTDGGATFGAFGSADTGRLPLCFFDGSCSGPPPPGLVMLDKPWLAVDTGHSRYAGSAYLVWARTDIDTGTRRLLFARSRDGGRTYSNPVQLDSTTEALQNGLEELAQIAVRPDGTVDVVWNSRRHSSPVMLHAVSRNGGASFQIHRLVTLRARSSPLGIVSSLAVSANGRLGLCWSQARSARRYDAKVACRLTDRSGRWGSIRVPLPGQRLPEYLPAVAFSGERLWVAGYVSGPRSTRLVAIRSTADGFGEPQTLNRWPVPRRRICGPHPPDCRQGQTFIGDYIGLAATRERLTAAYIKPSTPGARNQVLVTTLAR